MIGELGPRQARYPGNLELPTTLGQAVGPNTFGEFLVAVGAEYDPLQESTIIWYRYAQMTPEDVQAVNDHVRTVTT